MRHLTSPWLSLCEVMRASAGTGLLRPDHPSIPGPKRCTRPAWRFNRCVALVLADDDVGAAFEVCLPRDVEKGVHAPAERLSSGGSHRAHEARYVTEHAAREIDLHVLAREGKVEVPGLLGPIRAFSV